MSTNHRRIAAIVLPLFASLALSSNAVAKTDTRTAAENVIQKMTTRVLQILHHNKGKRVTSAVKKEITEAVIPHVNFSVLSAYIMAVYWRQMTKQQQQSFEALIKDLLVKTYSTALKDYRGQKITVNGSQVIAKQPPIVQVNTTIDGTKNGNIPVTYALIEQHHQWKIYDVVVDGVNLVLNFREEFVPIAQESGIPAVLIQLEHKLGQKLKMPAQHPATPEA